MKLTNFNGGNITVGQIPNAIKLIEKTKRTLLLQGMPGCGKSAQVYKYGKDNGYKVSTFTGGLFSKNSIYGVDFINPDKKVTSHYLAEWYQEALEYSNKVILFLDDFANAKPQEAMILQQILGDRKLGNYDLSADKFIIIAATNRQSDNSNVFAISNAILNRCCVLQVNLDPNEFIEFAKQKFHPSIPSFLKDRLWAISDDIEFLGQYKVPEEAIGYGAKEASNAIVHPSPRTWEAVSDILYEDQSNLLREDNLLMFREVVGGFIGNSLTPLFIKSIKSTLNIPSIEELLNNINNDYSKLIPSDHEALSSIIFTIFQTIAKESEKFNKLKEEGSIVCTYKNNRPVYEYPIITDLFNILFKIKKTKFSTINSEVLVNTMLDKFVYGEYFSVVITIGSRSPDWLEYTSTQNKIQRVLNEQATS